MSTSYFKCPDCGHWSISEVTCSACSAELKDPKSGVSMEVQRTVNMAVDKDQKKYSLLVIVLYEVYGAIFTANESGQNLFIFSGAAQWAQPIKAKQCVQFLQKEGIIKTLDFLEEQVIGLKS